MHASPTGLTRRLVAALLALLLLVLQGGVEAAHACPVHDAGVPAAESHGQDQHAAHGPAATAPDNEAGEHCCTCLGSCLTTAPVVLTTGTPDFSWLALESSARAERVRTDARRSPLPRLLPFATAPPLG